MTMRKKTKSIVLPLTRIYKEHIEGTAKKAIVTVEEIHLCSLTIAVQSGLNISIRKVNMNTRCLKHIYDKRPSEEFNLVIKYLPITIKYPTYITENKPGKKRGNYCFIKKIKHPQKGEIEILCVLEKVTRTDGNIIIEEIYVATAFQIRDKNYLSDCKLIWSWKGDKPSS